MTDGVKIELGRRYRFAASHRLHSEKLSEEENLRVYGKCNNPYGHGHNYVLEISVSGPVDPATGMIANLADLDGFVEREVIEAFDHRSLNEEVAAFRERVPTTENVCIEIYERLKHVPNAKLERVRIEETANNSFEYAGEESKIA
jgi:6-pyruvoyltetrahydropterin/6-carboxytetrahydropterin synthase